MELNLSSWTNEPFKVLRIQDHAENWRDDPQLHIRALKHLAKVAMTPEFNRTHPSLDKSAQVKELLHKVCDDIKSVLKNEDATLNYDTDVLWHFALLLDHMERKDEALDYLQRMRGIPSFGELGDHRNKATFKIANIYADFYKESGDEKYSAMARETIKRQSNPHAALRISRRLSRLSYEFEVAQTLPADDKPLSEVLKDCALTQSNIDKDGFAKLSY